MQLPGANPDRGDVQASQSDQDFTEGIYLAEGSDGATAIGEGSQEWITFEGEMLDVEQ